MAFFKKCSAILMAFVLDAALPCGENTHRRPSDWLKYHNTFDGFELSDLTGFCAWIGCKKIQI
jgi:hypothetical protein